MAPPIVAGLAISAITGAISSAVAGVAGSQQANAQAEAAKYNATVLKQQGVQATNTAASNMAVQQRRAAADLGEQAAALGQANIGTGGSAAAVEKQSRTNAQMDALNIWYGGELERKQSLDAANLERYNSLVDKRASDTALIGGGVGAGTSLLLGGAKYGAYKGWFGGQGGSAGLANYNVGFGNNP